MAKDKWFKNIVLILVGIGAIGGILAFNFSAFLSEPLAESDDKPLLCLPHAWAVAASGVLIEYNKARHEYLSPRYPNKNNLDRSRKMLDEWWGINSRVFLFMILKSLDEGGGHRQDFEDMGREVSALDDNAYEELLQKANSDKEEIHKLKTVRKHYEELGDKGILGWDYSRYIFLCRYAYLLGFISEQEAWDLIMPVAKRLQETFDSWEDLGENYLIGRTFWSYQQTEKSGDLFQEAYERLVKHPGSPWNCYSWDMNLDVSCEDAKQMDSTEKRLKEKLGNLYDKTNEKYVRDIDKYYYNRGWALHNKKEAVDKAIGEYQRSIFINPQFSWAHYGLAGIYALKGEKEQALHYLKIAIELDERNKDDAKKDSDFDSIKDDEEFRELLYGDGMKGSEATPNPTKP